MSPIRAFLFVIFASFSTNAQGQNLPPTTDAFIALFQSEVSRGAPFDGLNSLLDPLSVFSSSLEQMTGALSTGFR